LAQDPSEAQFWPGGRIHLVQLRRCVRVYVGVDVSRARANKYAIVLKLVHVHSNLNHGCGDRYRFVEDTEAIA